MAAYLRHLVCFMLHPADELDMWAAEPELDCRLCEAGDMCAMRLDI